ncbi:hypothetical protein M422DRAFT_78737, partial [Sphaerobolus stellatus SS14]
NMAAAIYDTISSLGLNSRIQAIVSDNAANNDTMMQELESLFLDDDIEFNAIYARGRCLPHTVHLAALKLLEGIGALSPDDVRKSEQSGYQESATLPIGRDIDAFVPQTNEEEN